SLRRQPLRTALHSKALGVGPRSVSEALSTASQRFTGIMGGSRQRLRAVLDQMLFDLGKLHGQREHFQRTLEPSVFDPQDEDYRVVAPVELSMDIEKSGGNAFRVTGRAATRLELSCSRCIEPFAAPVEAAFELRYVPAEQ